MQIIPQQKPTRMRIPLSMHIPITQKTMPTHPITNTIHTYTHAENHARNNATTTTNTNNNGISYTNATAIPNPMPIPISTPKPYQNACKSNYKSPYEYHCTFKHEIPKIP